MVQQILALDRGTNPSISESVQLRSIPNRKHGRNLRLHPRLVS
jgi:hypothetical protein